MTPNRGPCGGGALRMPRWEHRVEATPPEERLAQLGQDGWELVAVLDGKAYLKRPAPGYRERVTLAQRARALAADPAPTPRAPRLLHPEVYRVFASSGHTDCITICDRGFPVPLGPERLDLAIADDLPTVLDILRLTADRFPPDRLVVPEEAQVTSPGRVVALRTLLPGTPVDLVPHLEFKEIAASARATVRTGDGLPYANVIWVG